MLIAREGGKPLTDARAETSRAINGVESAAGELEHLVGREIPMGLSPASRDRWAITTKEPIGVVGAISAFNHPLNLIVHQVTPAIATRCSVIIKPANTTPLSCRRFVELVHEARLPPGWCQTLVVEEIASAEGLATHPSIAFLSFIGSAKVGWHLRSKLAPGARTRRRGTRHRRCSVEIGATVESLVKGGYYHAGQVRVSVQRIFVHADIMTRLVEHLTERVRALRVDDPTSHRRHKGDHVYPVAQRGRLSGHAAGSRMRAMRDYTDRVVLSVMPTRSQLYAPYSIHERSSHRSSTGTASK
jgi:acyl-CoA reductase-like NAD-dependent aldehyde dehydrogenase